MIEAHKAFSASERDPPNGAAVLVLEAQVKTAHAAARLARVESVCTSLDLAWQ